MRCKLTDTACLEVDSEDGGVEAALDVVEPRLLLRGGDSVQGAERKAEQAVESALLGKGGRDSLGRLDSLLRD